MKKYLLVVFGDFKNAEVVTGLAHGMATIVDSEFLKYQQTTGCLIFHFASEVIEEDLYDFIVGLFYGTSENFILTEMTDKTSVYMPENIKAHLLDLENDSDEVDIKIDMPRMGKSVDDMSEKAEDFVSFLLEEMEDEIKVPTLNQILDKINETGISSLSGFEKEILDEYSKN